MEWSPLKRGGTNFRTHRLISVEPDVMTFKATTGARVFYSLFLLFGIVPSVFAFVSLMKYGDPTRAEVLIPAAFGSVFGLVGFFLFWFGTRPIVFDRNRGYFWKGRKDPDAVWSHDELKHFAELKDVCGLQIIAENVKSDKGSFMSYELNLVLNDGSRMNVVDHGNGVKLQDDAVALADFLEVPILKR